MLPRYAVIVLALALFPSAAYADCESEAGKARDNIVVSGSFHYASHQWNKNFDRVQAGMIQPNKAEHIVESTQNGQRSSERIFIDTQSWANDGFGWLPPLAAKWSHPLTVPDSPYQALKTKCLGEVEVEAHALIGYEIEARISPFPATHVFLEKIFVDPNSGLTVRYERTGDNPAAINIVSSYRYDESIKIEPPQIDLAARKAKSLQAFQLAVDSADAKCRQEVIDTIDRGQTALPFRYQMSGYFWSGVSGMHGTFVPPSSVRNIVDGVPYHGGGSETVTIGNQAWNRLTGQEWIQTSNPSPLAGAVSASWSGVLSLPPYIGPTQHVGGAICLGEIEKDHARYRLYEYDVYLDFDTARKHVSKRRMYVDAATGLPVLFEDIGHGGQVLRREARTYDRGLTIAPPTVGPALPGQSAP